MGVRKHDYDAVLDAWAQGQTCGQIARRMGIPNGSVRSILSQGRRRYDPRAVFRTPVYRALRAELDRVLAENRKLRAELGADDLEETA